MKKCSALFVGLFCILLILAGCSSTPTKNTSSEEIKSAKPKDLVVTHSMGEATITVSPKKVVVLDPGALDNILALGVKPIGATTMSLELPFPEYLKDQTSGIENLGTAYEPNLEAIAKLKPDVIFGNKDYHEKLYEQLKVIAPTVIVKTAGTTWKENLLVQAEALGLEDKGKEILSDYQSRIDTYKKKLGTKASETEISLLRGRTDKVSLYLRQSFSGSIIEELGFSRPASQTKDDFALDANNEAFPEMDGDYIFWFTRDNPNIIESNYLNNPVWNNLGAVKNKQVFKVPYDTWLSGLGIQAANRIIDDVEKYIK